MLAPRLWKVASMAFSAAIRFATEVAGSATFIALAAARVTSLAALAATTPSKTRFAAASSANPGVAGLLARKSASAFALRALRALNAVRSKPSPSA